MYIFFLFTIFLLFCSIVKLKKKKNISICIYLYTCMYTENGWKRPPNRCNTYIHERPSLNFFPLPFRFAGIHMYTYIYVCPLYIDTYFNCMYKCIRRSFVRMYIYVYRKIEVKIFELFFRSFFSVCACTDKNRKTREQISLAFEIVTKLILLCEK